MCHSTDFFTKLKVLRKNKPASHGSLFSDGAPFSRNIFRRAREESCGQWGLCTQGNIQLVGRLWRQVPWLRTPTLISASALREGTALKAAGLSPW